MIQLFNILLMSLSIATILLTLISYILYKVRQLPSGPGQHAHETTKIEGVYFRRYFPGEVKSAQGSLPSGPVESRWAKYIPRTVGAFFITVSSVIFVTLSIQFLWNGTSGFFSQRRRQALRAEGLLQHHKLELTRSDTLKEEFIFPQDKARLEAVLSELRKRKIVIVQSPANRTLDRRRVVESFSSWTSFLDENQVPYRKAQDLSAARSGTDLVILPRAFQLSAYERTAINAAEGKGISFLATGPIGMGAGALDPTAAHWREETFGVRLIVNPLASNFYPTLFVSGAAPWWDIPAGLDAPWLPLDMDYKAVATAGQTAMYEGDYNGLFNGIDGYANVTQVTRAQFLQGKRARSAWLNNDPILPGNELTEAEKYYVRTAFVHALAWSAGVPSARVSTWKMGRRAAMVVFLDTEDKFENVDLIADTFKAAGFPSTFFVVSNLFSEHPQMMKHMTADMEIQSHSENHKPFDVNNLAEQFDRIQQSRFEIETISHKTVVGFRPPNERYNPDTLNASLQNHLLFFVGERAFLRYFPTWIASGKMLFFSRVLDDDISLKREGLLEEEDEFTSKIADAVDFIQKFNGLYLLGLHTQNFFEGKSIDMLSKALHAVDERTIWKTNFTALYQWLKSRRDLYAVLSPSETEGQYQLLVKNDGEAPVGDFDIELDTGNADILKLQERAVATPGGVPHLVQDRGDSLLRIDRIDPKQTLTFNLEAVVSQ